MKIQMEIWMGYEFFGEKIIFPSAPVPGVNNDQSLIEDLCTGAKAVVLYSGSLFRELDILQALSKT